MQRDPPLSPRSPLRPGLEPSSEPGAARGLGAGSRRGTRVGSDEGPQRGLGLYDGAVFRELLAVPAGKVGDNVTCVGVGCLLIQGVQRQSCVENVLLRKGSLE